MGARFSRLCCLLGVAFLPALLLAVGVFGHAYAQTNTPTPAGTPTPSGPTPTPTFNIWDVTPDAPAYMFCYNGNWAGAWDCSGMGDYIEVDLETTQCGGTWLYNPSTSPYYRYGVIVSHLHTEVITATCQIATSIVKDLDCTATCSGNNSARVYEGSAYIVAYGDTSSVTVGDREPFQMVWAATTGQYLPGYLPTTGTDEYPYIRATSNAKGDTAGHCTQTRARVACEITGVKIDGVENIKPWVKTWPTATPSGPFVGMTPWATPVGWTRVVSQTILTVPPSVAVGDTECTNLLPTDWGWEEQTIFGWTIPAGAPPQMRICGQARTLSLTVMGWDLGAMAAVVGTMGIFAAIYFMFKQNG